MLVKLLLPDKITNMNTLTSDHNLILLEVLGTPITSFPPTAKLFINWLKFSHILTNQHSYVKPNVSHSATINQAIDHFTTFIPSAILASSYTPNIRDPTSLLRYYSRKSEKKITFDVSGSTAETQ